MTGRGCRPGRFFTSFDKGFVRKISRSGGVFSLVFETQRVYSASYKQIEIYCMERMRWMKKYVRPFVALVLVLCLCVSLA